MSQFEKTLCDERTKNIIHHFYMVKDMPLLGKSVEEGGKGKGLIEFMESHHGFKKSKPQYERLFKKWGWAKNRPKEEYRIIEQKVKERKKRGIDSNVYLEGDLIPRKRLQKEFSRKGYMTTQEKMEILSHQNQKLGYEVAQSPQTPAAFDIRTPLPESIFRLAFDNLPILGFLPSLHDGLQAMPQPSSLTAKNSWSLLSNQSNVQPSHRQFIDAILPNSHLLEEPQAWGLAVQNTEDLNHAQFLSMASYLLSNNLSTDTNGEAMYKWMKENGEISTLRIISSFRSHTAKSFLECLFRLTVEAGDTPVVKYLLEIGVSPNGHRCKYRYPQIIPDILDPLQTACLHGDIEMALLLLRSGLKVVEEREGWKASLIVLAIIGGNRGRKGPEYPFNLTDSRITHGETDETALLKFVKQLAEAGATINLNVPSFYSPLSVAAKFLNVGLVRYLIEAGADVNFCSSTRASVLQVCLWGRSPNGVDNTRERWWRSTRSSEWNTVTRILLDSGANPNYSAEIAICWNIEPTPVSVLDLAAWSGNISLLELLITQGAIITEKCLEYALRSLDLNSFQYLLKHNALHVTWRGVDLMRDHAKAPSEWAMALAKGHPRAHTKKHAMLAAIMYDSWELMSTILRAGNFRWKTLLRDDKLYTYDFERTYEEDNGGDKHYEEDEDGDEERDVKEENKNHLETAVAYCAGNGQLTVFLNIVPRRHVPMSTSTRYLSIALLNYIWSTDRNPILNFTASTSGNSGEQQEYLEHRRFYCKLELIQKLILMGADINHGFHWVKEGKEQILRGTILVNAIACGNDMIIEGIIKAGADLDAVGYYKNDNKYYTPLGAAIKTKSKKWTGYLLDAQADVNNPPEFGNAPTALSAAIHHHDLNLFHLLLERGARPCYEDLLIILRDYGPEYKRLHFLPHLLDRMHANTTRETILKALRTANDCRHVQAVSLILERKLVDLNSVLDNTRLLYYVLRSSMYDKSFELLRMLLCSGADPNLPFCGVAKSGSFQVLPLLSVVERNDCTTASLLLQNGALPNAIVPRFTLTTLHFAAHHGNDEMAHMLLGYGAVPDFHFQQDTTSIQTIKYCSSRLFEDNIWMLDPLEIADLCKDTPLQIASRNGHKEVAETLIAHGANVNAPPAKYSGATALQYAAMHGYMGIAYLLLENGAEVNAAPAVFDGRTALEGAAEHGRIDTVQLLLNYGAEIHGAGQIQYERALTFASENGHHALRELLEERHA